MQELIIIGGIALLLYLFTTRRNDIEKELYLAAIISLIWVNISGLYTYSDANYVFYGINLFAFVAWTTGLVIVKEYYENMKGKNKFIRFTITYMIAMVVVEYIGYNFMGIKLASNYPGIFGIEAMHMPLFGQMYYLIAGPVYVKICEYLKIR